MNELCKQADCFNDINQKRSSGDPSINSLEDCMIELSRLRQLLKEKDDQLSNLIIENECLCDAVEKKTSAVLESENSCNMQLICMRDLLKQKDQQLGDLIDENDCLCEAAELGKKKLDDLEYQVQKLDEGTRYMEQGIAESIDLIQDIGDIAQENDRLKGQVSSLKDSDARQLHNQVHKLEDGSKYMEQGIAESIGIIQDIADVAQENERLNGQVINLKDSEARQLFDDLSQQLEDCRGESRYLQEKNKALGEALQSLGGNPSEIESKIPQYTRLGKDSPEKLFQDGYGKKTVPESGVGQDSVLGARNEPSPSTEPGAELGSVGIPTETGLQQIGRGEEMREGPIAGQGLSPVSALKVGSEAVTEAGGVAAVPAAGAVAGPAAGAVAGPAAGAVAGPAAGAVAGQAAGAVAGPAAGAVAGPAAGAVAGPAAGAVAGPAAGGAAAPAAGGAAAPAAGGAAGPAAGGTEAGPDAGATSGRGAGAAAGTATGAAVGPTTGGPATGTVAGRDAGAAAGLAVEGAAATGGPATGTAAGRDARGVSGPDGGAAAGTTTGAAAGPSTGGPAAGTAAERDAGAGGSAAGRAAEAAVRPATGAAVGPATGAAVGPATGAAAGTSGTVSGASVGPAGTAGQGPVQEKGPSPTAGQEIKSGAEQGAVAGAGQGTEFGTEQGGKKQPGPLATKGDGAMTGQGAGPGQRVGPGSAPVSGPGQNQLADPVSRAGDGPATGLGAIAGKSSEQGKGQGSTPLRGQKDKSRASQSGLETEGEYGKGSSKLGRTSKELKSERRGSKNNGETSGTTAFSTRSSRESSRLNRFGKQENKGMRASSRCRDDGQFDDFVRHTVQSLSSGDIDGCGLERELRKILDMFVDECGFCFCKCNIPKSRFYAICHKLYHHGLHTLEFKELVYMHKRIYAAAENILPGCLFNMIVKEMTGVSCVPTLLSSHNSCPSPVTTANKCCSCRNMMCCDANEEKLMRKVMRLESDIENAKMCLQNLKSIPSRLSIPRCRLDVGDSSVKHLTVKPVMNLSFN